MVRRGHWVIVEGTMTTPYGTADRRESDMSDDRIGALAAHRPSNWSS